eukprot:gene4836-5190_t
MTTISQHLRRKVLLIGDSITEQSFSAENRGWGAALADWYGRSADVVNRGYSGYNSRWMQELLPRLLPEKDDNIILSTIFLGANDSSKEGQHVPLEEYQENLLKLVQRCQWVNEKMEIILITPPTVDNIRWKDRHPSVVIQYARKVLELAHRLRTEGNSHIHVISLWAEEELSLPSEISLHRWWEKTKRPAGLRGVELGEDLYDGLHLGEGGNQVVFTHLTGCIKAELPPSTIPANAITPPPPVSAGYLGLHYPHWSELIDKNPEQIESLLSSWRW